MNRLKEEARIAGPDVDGSAGAGRDGRADDPGYLPFARSGGQLLFHFVGKLYERASMTLNNLALDYWRSVIDDPKNTTVKSRLL